MTACMAPVDVSAATAYSSTSEISQRQMGPSSASTSSSTLAQLSRRNRTERAPRSTETSPPTCARSPFAGLRHEHQSAARARPQSRSRDPAGKVRLRTPTPLLRRPACPSSRRCPRGRRRRRRRGGVPIHTAHCRAPPRRGTRSSPRSPPSPTQPARRTARQTHRRPAPGRRPKAASPAPLGPFPKRMPRRPSSPSPTVGRWPLCPRSGRCLPRRRREVAG